MDADVIVIGAGAAGLAAARSVARRSLNVIVLEAQDRIGGRVFSHDIPGSAVPAELGAEFIHGPARETMALLRSAGIQAVEVGGDTWALDESGILRLEDSDFMAAARSVFTGGHASLQDESVATFLARLEGNHTNQDLVHKARAFVEGFEAADPEIADVGSIADELRSGVDAGGARPSGGYRPMFDFLAAQCQDEGVQIRLSSTVRRIKWQPGFVTLEGNAGHNAVMWSARAAIVTLPVGVLRGTADEPEVAVEPSLPAVKQEALRYLEMGHVIKVVLQFRTPFWEEIHGGRYRNAGFFRTRPNQPFAVYWTQLPLRVTHLVAWAGGPKAVALRNSSPSAIVEQALEGLGTLFGEPALVRAEFIEAFMHDWDADPFTRGAYSYVVVGGAGARAALASSIAGTLFFAGEATSIDGQDGTVNGALVTGERAAEEVAAALHAPATRGA